MIAKVYHARVPTGYPTDETGPLQRFPDDFTLVAEVEVEPGYSSMLEQAFKLTNSIFRHWRFNSRVRCLVRGRPRSTSVGDVVELEDGSRWQAQMIGWRRI